MIMSETRHARFILMGILALCSGFVFSGCDESGDGGDGEAESSADLCLDGYDNDDDGTVDCDDAECAGFCDADSQDALSDFEDILFVKRDFIPTYDHGSGGHMCDQYHGFNGPTGGGLFILEDVFSASPTARDVLEGSVVVSDGSVSLFRRASCWWARTSA